jgi:hypothetical protein
MTQANLAPLDFIHVVEADVHFKECSMNRRTFVAGAGSLLAFTDGVRAMAQSNPETPQVPHTSIHRIEADGLSIFYRAAGRARRAPASRLPYLFIHVPGTDSTSC